MINGVVLAGGRSSRMGKDKARLVYGGRTQLGRLRSLLRPLCHGVFVSLRPEQEKPAEFEEDRVIRDAFGELGPVGGILSALDARPGQAFLAVACDLPLLDLATLETLLERRQRSSDVTAFRRPGTGEAEPLCAIYEPSAFEPLMLALRDHPASAPLTLLLERLEVHLLELPATDALDSTKTPEDYEAVFSRIRRTPNPFCRN